MISVHDYPTIQKAADAVPDTGGSLYFRSGEHNFTEPVHLKSNTMVFGEGWSSRLVRRGAKANPMFLCLQAHGVRFQNLSMDVNLKHGENYLTAIRFGSFVREVIDGIVYGELPSTDCSVENVLFHTGGDLPSPGDTIHAVLSNNTHGLTLDKCKVMQMQFKCSSKGNAGPCIVTRNRFVEPHNFAVSFVGEDQGDYQHGLTIAHNTVEGVASSGGFFIGGDGENSASGLLEHVTIEGNHIYGDWGGKAFSGIHLLLARITRNVKILGNTVECKNEAPSNSLGISIKAPNAGAHLEQAIIANNQVRNVDLHGIRVHVADGLIENLLITGNQVWGTRGIQTYGRGTVEIPPWPHNQLHVSGAIEVLEPAS